MKISGSNTMFTCGILIRKREPKRIKTVNRSVSPIFKCMPTIWFFSAINKLTPVVIRIAMKGSDLPKEGRAVIETERDASMGGYSTKPGHTGDLSKYSMSIIRITPAKGSRYYSGKSRWEADPSAIFNNVVYRNSEKGLIAVRGDETLFDSPTFTVATPERKLFRLFQMR